MATQFDGRVVFAEEVKLTNSSIMSDALITTGDGGIIFYDSPPYLGFTTFMVSASYDNTDIIYLGIGEVNASATACIAELNPGDKLSFTLDAEHPPKFTAKSKSGTQRLHRLLGK